MKVKELMSEDPTCCSPDTKLTNIAKTMVNLDCGSIPVVMDLETRKPVIGVVTDRDIVCRSLAADRDPSEMTAKDVMSQPVITVKPNDDVEECRRLMEINMVRRIPVVDDTGFLCGVVTQARIARHLSSDKAGELLKKVSEPTESPSRVITA